MNDAWAKAWCEAMNSGDAERLVALYSPDVVFEDVPFEVTAAGEAFRSVMAHFISGDFTCRFVAYSGDDRGGALEWIWSATHAGDLLGVDADGKSTETRIVTVMAFDDQGYVSRHCDYWDARTTLAQLESAP